MAFLFGNNDTFDGNANFSGGYKHVGRFTLAADAEIASLRLNIWTASGSTNTYGLIYSVGGDQNPAARLACTPVLSIGGATGWQALTFSTPVELSAGDYYIGWYSANALYVSRVTALNDGVIKSGQFENPTTVNANGGPADPFGSVSTTLSYHLGIYADGALAADTYDPVSKQVVVMMCT